MKKAINTTIFLSICSILFGQMQNYNYKRELKGIEEKWHSITIPDEVYKNVSQDLYDLRVYGITTANDTIEAPYFLDENKEQIIDKDVAFKIINTAHNQRGYFYTFDLAKTKQINQIRLDFLVQNFDWNITLEGSQNQAEWFTVLEGYRIVSIRNDLTNYQFTTLHFPTAKYRYFRLLIHTNENPNLSVAHISKREVTQGEYRKYEIIEILNKLNKESNRSEIIVRLQKPVRINRLKVFCDNDFDYYRPVTIHYLYDSVKTEKGWIQNYRWLASGTLNSMEDNVFTFQDVISSQLKIYIQNQNNQPLNVSSVEVLGNIIELLTRFTEPAQYNLVYGNEIAQNVYYDISYFKDKIPQNPTQVQVGEEQIIKKTVATTVNPLFENKIWLWLIMAVIIAVLGWFTFKMLKKM